MDAMIASLSRSVAVSGFPLNAVERRKMLLAVADVAGDVARQLCKGPATPTKVAKAVKKLACLDKLFYVISVTAQELASNRGIATEDAWSMVLSARFTLARSCGHLVVIQAWLCGRDARQLWLEQGSQIPRVVKTTLQVLRHLIVVPYDVPKSMRLEAHAARDTTTDSALAAGWLNILPTLLDSVHAYAHHALHAACGQMLDAIGQILLHVVDTLTPPSDCNVERLDYMRLLVHSMDRTSAIVLALQRLCIEQQGASSGGRAAAGAASSSMQSMAHHVLTLAGVQTRTPTSTRTAVPSAASPFCIACDDTAESVYSLLVKLGAAAAALLREQRRLEQEYSALDVLPGDGMQPAALPSSTVATDAMSTNTQQDEAVLASEASADEAAKAGVPLHCPSPAGTALLATSQPRTTAAALPPPQSMPPLASAAAAAAAAADTEAAATPGVSAAPPTAVTTTTVPSSAPPAPTRVLTALERLRGGAEDADPEKARLCREMASVCISASLQPSLHELAIETTAARLAQQKVPTADCTAVPLRYSCQRLHHTCAAAKSVPNRLWLSTSLSSMQMSVAYAAYDMPASGGMARRPVQADELLLLLEALLLTPDGLLAPGNVQHWAQLCNWITRLSDAELEVFCQHGCPSLVAHLVVEAAIASSAVAPNPRSVGSLIAAVRALLASRSSADAISVNVAQGSQSEFKPMFVVQSLVMGNNAQLMAVLEGLLRAHPTCLDYATTTSMVLLEVHRHGTLVSDIVDDPTLSQALIGLVSTFSKWLLINASPQHHPTLALPEVLEEPATRREELVFPCCCQFAFEACVLAVAASHCSVGAVEDAVVQPCNSTSSRGNGGGAACDATASDAPAALKSPDKDVATCSDVVSHPSSGAPRRLDEALLLIVGKLSGAAARVVDRLLLSGTVKMHALTRGTCLEQAGMMCQSMPASGVLHALAHAMVASGMYVPKENPWPWGSETSSLTWESMRPWWEVFLKLPQPVHLTVGCHNPTCTNLQGNSEAQLKTKVCTGCKATRFCSKQCLTEAWPVHKKACKAMAAARAGMSAVP